MGFFDELKKLTRPYDDADDDFFGSASDDAPAQADEPAAERRSSFFSTPEEAEPESVGIPSAPAVKPKIRIPRRELRRQADAADAEEAAAQGAGRAAPANAKPRMSMASPTKFVDGAKLADSLLAGDTILLNLEKANKVDARRLLDFLSGAAYAMQGYVRRVSGSIYLVVPNGEEISEADAMSRMETNGVFF